MVHILQYCNFGGAHWLLFGPNVPPLIYYSHIPNIIISVFLAFYILFQNKKSLANNILFYTILAFEVWVFFALIFWATNRSDVVMFSWAMDIIFEPLVYIGALYLLYSLVVKKDVSFNIKLVLGLLYLPILVIIPAGLAFSGFDVTSCLAIETKLSYYSYVVEIITTLWILIYGIWNFIVSKSSELRKEIAYVTIGIMLLLVAFAWGNIIGSFSDNWILGDYGLFGMPVFIGFLVYSIVKFKTFNIKLLGTQVLIISQSVILASLFFIRDINYIYGVIAVSLILFVFLGIMLIRGVKREISLRESLQVANEQQETLIHFISHQIKGFLSTSRNIFSFFMQEEYGPLPEYLKAPTKEGFDSGTRGVGTIQEILSAANLKKGTIDYKSVRFDVKNILLPIIDEQKKNAENRGLALEAHIDQDKDFGMTGDPEQIEHALRNLVDNGIKYTLSGGLKVNLTGDSDKIIFSVQDTGVGINPLDRPQLFTEGVRGRDALKVNVDSTGYGLFIVKKIVEAHKGKVWVDSDGPGKGSTFYIELPKNG